MIHDQKHNVLIFLLVMAFFTGATIQLSEGSVLIGIVMFLIALAFTIKIRLSGAYITRSSKFFIVLGVFIVLADIAYNLKTVNQLGTLDSMTFFMGASFIAYGTGQYRRMGEFGIYMSGTFIMLFLMFYSILPSLNNNFIHYFDHYFVLLPSLAIADIFSNIDIHIITTETVQFKGFEDATVLIGGPCSGLYSMFLLIGIIAGYVRMERLKDKHRVILLVVLTISVAYISNLVRVAVLYNVGYFYGIEKMMFVHIWLGWVIFIIIAFVIMMILNRTK